MISPWLVISGIHEAGGGGQRAFFLGWGEGVRRGVIMKDLCIFICPDADFRYILIQALQYVQKWVCNGALRPPSNLVAMGYEFTINHPSNAKILAHEVHAPCISISFTNY